MNEFNVLLGAATNDTPSGSLFDALFARYIAPQESWRELESPLPITILSAGEDLIDYRIYGNTVQTGTPTPENPIMPEGVGERTENLCPDVTVLSLAYSSTISTGNLFNTLKNIKPDITHRISWLYESNGSGGVTNQIRLYTPGANLVKLINNGSAFSLTAEEIAAFTTIVAYFGISNTNGKMSNFMLTEGSTALPYEPYGYKLPLTVQSANLFDENARDTSKGYVANAYLDAAGDIIQYSQFMVSEYLPVQATSTYLFTGNNYNSAGTHIVVYNTNKDVIAAVKINRRDIVPVYTPVNAAFVRLSFSLVPSDIKKFVCVKEENIYIGSDPLAEDEYVDFGKQKVYRMEGGTLTPTDPPVPLPALPTIRGETIIDYNPSETPAVEPEKMYVKFKPRR